MFALFAVLAWVIVMIAAVFIIAFSAYTLMCMITALGASGDNPAGALDLKNNALLKFFSKTIFGSENPITNLLFFNDTNAHDLLSTNHGGLMFTMYGTPALSFLLGALLMTISIGELVRLKKSQKISKPFVKIILVITIVTNILMGILATTLVAGLLFVALIFLEVVLFDTDALNNYAEERNLISIYHEEKRFGKEVAKEGKQTDNTVSEAQKVQKEKNLNMSDQDEKVKTSDNTVLLNPQMEYSEIPSEVTNPELIENLKYKKYYKQWRDLKDQLQKFKEECFNKAGQIKDENKRRKLQTKYNDRAEKLNVIASELKLAPSFKEEYIDLSNIKESQNNEQIANKTFDESEVIKTGGALVEATTAFGGTSSSTDYHPDVENIYKENSKKVDDFVTPNFETPSFAPTPNENIPEGFVLPSTKAVDKYKERKEADKKFIKIALERAVRMSFDSLPETKEAPNYDFKTLESDLGIYAETKDISYTSKDLAKAAPTPAPEFSNEAPRFETKLSEPPKFGTVEDIAAPNLEKPDDLGANPDSFGFKIPGNVATEELNKRAIEEKKFLQMALSRAVKMDFDMIPAANTQADSTIEDIEIGLGVKAETKDISYSNSQVKNLTAESSSQNAENEVKVPNQIPQPQMSAPKEPVSFKEPDILNEIKSHSPNNNGEDKKIDQIEKRMENIEKMIQSLSVSQSYSNTSSLETEDVAKIKEEFYKIEEQLSRISNSFNISSAEPKNLFGALIRGYKYNNQK